MPYVAIKEDDFEALVTKLATPEKLDLLKLRTLPGVKKNMVVEFEKINKRALGLPKEFFLDQEPDISLDDGMLVEILMRICFPVRL